MAKAESQSKWGLIAVIFVAGGLALFLANGLSAGEQDGLFLWQQERWQLLLWAAGVWLWLLAGLLALTIARPVWFERLAKWELSRWAVSLVLVGLILVFVIGYSWLAIRRHQNFNSTGYDLAINEQIVWNTLNGRFFASSLEVDNSFADHFRPFLLAMMPFYAVSPRPETLLVLQTIGLALGAIPLYFLAKEQWESKVAALGITAVYLLFPALGYMARFDFHIEIFAIPAFLAAFYMLTHERWGWATFWLIVPLLCKENMGLIVAMFGVYALIKQRTTFSTNRNVTRTEPVEVRASTGSALVSQRNLKWGVAWIVLGLATFWLASFWLIPLVRGEASDTMARYGWLGESLVDMLITAVTHPSLIWQELTQPYRLFYLIQLLLPLGFLALFGWPEFLLVLPGLGLNLLAQHHCQSAIYCQYTAPVVPFLFIAAVFGVSALRRLFNVQPLPVLLALLLLPMAAYSLWVDNPFVETTAVPDALTPPDNADVVRQALAVVPLELSLVTTNDYAPHLAQREELYVIGLPSQRVAPVDPEVVFINLYDQQYIVCDQYREYVSQLDVARYGVTFRTGGLIVMQRDAGDNALFRDFVENWNNCAG